MDMQVVPKIGISSVVHSKHIDPGSIDVGMTQYIGQFGDILLRCVKHHGEQMAQVMWKYLLRVNPRRAGQPLHFPPDIRAIHRTASLGLKDRPASNAASFRPF